MSCVLEPDFESRPNCERDGSKVRSIRYNSLPSTIFSILGIENMTEFFLKISALEKLIFLVEIDNKQDK